MNLSNIKIKIPLKGGLGNQMFGYTFYMYMKNKGYDVNIILTEFLFTYIHNGIEIFDIFPKITLNNKYHAKFYIIINTLLKNTFAKRCMAKFVGFYYSKFKIVNQINPYTFDSFKFSPNNTYLLNGFWQNYMYSLDMEYEIKSIFEFHIPEVWCNKYILDKIEKTNSVSIHVRRGDYLKNEFSDYNVIKTMNFYKDAISLIKEKISNPNFYIFSDDIQWCKDNFVGDEYVFIIGNTGKHSYLDMYMMSRCKHNIISNSTFSWWGAWLNNNDKKIVIAPKYWTNSGIKSADFCPDKWFFI